MYSVKVALGTNQNKSGDPSGDYKRTWEDKPCPQDCAPSLTLQQGRSQHPPGGTATRRALTPGFQAAGLKGRGTSSGFTPGAEPFFTSPSDGSQFGGQVCVCVTLSMGTEQNRLIGEGIPDPGEPQKVSSSAHMGHGCFEIGATGGGGRSQRKGR